MGCERSRDPEILLPLYPIEQSRLVKLRAGTSNDGGNESVLELMTKL